jgi:hypothetical protein
MLAHGVVLLHDNVRPHTAAHTQSLLEHFSWDFLDYAPYSPDLAQSDYHLFTYLKSWLSSRRFNNNEELTEGVRSGLAHRRQASSAQVYTNAFPDTTIPQF